MEVSTKPLILFSPIARTYSTSSGNMLAKRAFTSFTPKVSNGFTGSLVLDSFDVMFSWRCFGISSALSSSRGSRMVTVMVMDTSPLQ
jgi:hypothetical protein